MVCSYIFACLLLHLLHNNILVVLLFLHYICLVERTYAVMYSHRGDWRRTAVADTSVHQTHSHLACSRGKAKNTPMQPTSPMYPLSATYHRSIRTDVYITRLDLLLHKRKTGCACMAMIIATYVLPYARTQTYVCTCRVAMTVYIKATI